jgi:hypothetical protein
MAANDSLRITPLAVRSLAFGSVAGTYTAIGTASDDSSRLLLVQNLTDKTLMFSHNGTTDHYPLLGGAALILDITTNRTSTASGFYIAANTTIYCKSIGAAPTTGSVYVTFFVAQNGQGF